MTNAELVGGLPQISLIGTPRAIGEALGQRLKPRLQVLSEYLLENLAQNARLSSTPMSVTDIRGVISEAVQTVTSLEPSLAMELESISRTSGLKTEDLLAIHGYADFLAYLGASSAVTPSTFVSIPASHTMLGTPMQVLVWECDPVLLPYITLVHRIPAHGPASLSLTLAGLHPIAMLNEAGLAVCSNAMPVRDSQIGYLTSHLIAAMATAPGFSDASNRAKRGPRWGGRAIHILSSDGQRESIELSGERTAILPDPNQNVARVHTNHALSEELKDVVHDDPFSRLRLEHVAAAAIHARGIEPNHVTNWFGLERATTRHEPGNGVDTTARRKRGLVSNPDGCITFVLDPAQKCVYVRRGRNSTLERKAL